MIILQAVAQIYFNTGIHYAGETEGGPENLR
jgi:hypothetical protein